MSVVKFQTIVEDGSISIPTEFRNQIIGQIEVVVTINDNVNKSGEKDFLREMIENPMIDPDFVPFTREEIYDRT
jgi:hypothetical protein